MKKIIFIAVIAFVAFAAVGQDTVRTDFDYSIELLADTLSYGNGDVVIEQVSVYPLFFTPGNSVALNFKIERYNANDMDSLVYVGIDRKQAKLNNDELNAIVQGERIWRWLEMYYSDGLETFTPKAITKGIAKYVYYNKISGN